MSLVKTPQRYHTPTAYFRRWRVKGTERYLVEVNSKLGLPQRYLVVEKSPNGNELVISRHRSKRAASRAALGK